MPDLETAIHERLAEENTKDLYAGRLGVHAVKVHPLYDYGWTFDKNGNVLHHLILEEVGLVMFAQVFGVASDGGKGPLITTLAL